jgi:hypothetical protein
VAYSSVGNDCCGAATVDAALTGRAAQSPSVRAKPDAKLCHIEPGALQRARWRCQRASESAKPFEKHPYPVTRVGMQVPPTP